MKKARLPRIDVGDYYDRNTLHFLKSRKSRLDGAIHRRLYPPETKKTTRAEFYSNQLILEIIQKEKAERILDLGCGVGGTIRYLNDRYAGDYRGITISKVQRKLSLSFGTAIEIADFQDRTWFEKQNPFDLVFALESLQHNPDHEILSKNIGMICKTGSTLVVVDDFLFQAESHQLSRDKLIKRFKKHWYAHGYTSTDEFISHFKKEGFILREKQDLSSLMKKTPIATFILTLISRFLLFLPLKTAAFDNIIGGNALKQLQQKGYSGYFKLVFEYRKNKT